MPKELGEVLAEEAATDTRTNRKIFSFYEFFWATICLASASNVALEYVFASVKIEIAIISFLALLFRNIAYKLGSNKTLYYIVLASLLVSPLLSRGLNAYFIGKDPNFQFVKRVDTILDYNHHIYKSRIVPSAIYSIMKKYSDRLFVPELWDVHHDYDSIHIEFAQIGTMGVANYWYSGSTRGKDMEPFYFSSVGEAKILDEKLNTTVYHICPNGDTIVNKDFTRFDPEQKKDAFLYVASVPVDSLHFNVGYVIHAKNCMKKRREFFLVDLRNIVYPPKKIVVSLYTNKDVFNTCVWRISKRKKSLSHILMSYPDISFEWMPPPECTMREVDETKLEIAKQRVAEMMEIETPDIIAFEWNIIARNNVEDNVFLVEYFVN